MRKVKCIVTKDHYIFAARVYEINDEINAPGGVVSSGVKSSNTFIYLSSGNTYMFSTNTSHGHVKTAEFDSPGGWVRPNHGSNGMVNISPVGSVNSFDGNTTLTLVFTRYNNRSRDGALKEVVDENATEGELSTIENNQTQTVVLEKQCVQKIKRDLNTFEKYKPTVENTVTTEELNIDWE
jgi:hypothetical protein